MPHIHHDMTLTIGRRELDIVVSGEYEPYVPAKTLGRPEDCYPAEGGYFQISSIKRSLPGGKMGEEIELPPDLLAELEEDIYEEIASDEE